MWLDFVLENAILIGCLVVLAVIYWLLNGKVRGKSVSIHEVTRLINTGDAVLIDLRDAADYKAGHITGAISMAYSALAHQLHELEKYRNKTLILVDKMGQHSGEAGQLLLSKGFSAVRLSGGMSEWMAQSLPLVKGKK